MLNKIIKFNICRILKSLDYGLILTLVFFCIILPQVQHTISEDKELKNILHDQKTTFALCWLLLMFSFNLTFLSHLIKAIEL